MTLTATPDQATTSTTAPPAGGATRAALRGPLRRGLAGFLDTLARTAAHHDHELEATFASLADAADLLGQARLEVGQMLQVNLTDADLLPDLTAAYADLGRLGRGGDEETHRSWPVGPHVTRHQVPLAEVLAPASLADLQPATVATLTALWDAYARVGQQTLTAMAELAAHQADAERRRHRARLAALTLPERVERIIGAATENL